MKKSILILFALSLPLMGASLDPEFVRAIHLTETGGRRGAIIGDNGRALGPLQIHRVCWIDSQVAGDYSNCTNLAYSTKVMENYLNRYGSDLIKQKNYEGLARLWNSGPNWKKKTNSTNLYWQKVKSNLKN